MPLHVRPVRHLDYPYIVRHAQRHVRDRLDSLWSLLDRYTPNESYETPPLHGEWANSLLECGIVEAATDRSGRHLCSAFTVVEEKTAGNRLRFILWPHALNDWLAEQGYTPDVPLPRTPWQTAVAPWGAVCDLTCSFFQVHLPKRYRHLFRFADSFGRVWQMRALPMGLSLSPEIMHTLVATLGGDPQFCNAAWAAQSVETVTWIDNLQWTGEKHAVNNHLRGFQQRARRAHVTLNDVETTSATRYTFAGIVFDHEAHTVAIGAKAHGHLAQRPNFRSMTIAELERLLGRLWFAARVLRLPIHRYWWLMKTARRLMARLNRNLLSTQDVARLAPSARRQLQSWWEAAVANVPRRIHRESTQPACFDVYSDATPDGWGAVCIDRESKATIILGARWPRRADNINAAETRAITMALSELRPQFPPGCSIHLHVDNTSALASVERRRARSYAVNEEVHRLLPYLDRYHVTASYIASAANPADTPSRAH